MFTIFSLATGTKVDMKGAAAIASILKQEGIEYLFCYPRQPLIDACAAIDIKPIVCRQERVGMAMADGFIRVSGGKRLAVFAMQHGAGTENAFPGAAQAFADNVPLLMIPGGYHTDRIGTEPNFSSVDNFHFVTKWAALVNNAGRVPQLLRRAFHQLRNGKPGPVLLEVPLDVWDQEVGAEFDYTPARRYRSAADPADVAAVAKLLLDSRRLVIHAGGGVLAADASKELHELAELLHAPVMTTLPGKSSFREDHALALGASSVATTRAVAELLDACDTVFGIGTSFTRTSWGRTIPPGKILIHATNAVSEINKDYAASHALVGDAQLVLRALIDAVRASKRAPAGRYEGSAVVKQIAAAKQAWLKEWLPQLTSNEIPINPYRVIWDLMHTVDRANTILTHDAGSPRDQIVPFWECVAPHTYIGWGKTTQLGFGLGAIMGAKLAEPDKLCINVMGDSAIGMVGMDLETAVRCGIGILTLVFNNGLMAIEKETMKLANAKYESYLVGGNYTDLARALGCWSRRVERPLDIIPALQEAIAITRAGRPAVVEFMTKEGIEFSKYP